MNDRFIKVTGCEQFMDDLSIDKKKAEKRAEKMKEQEGEPLEIAKEESVKLEEDGKKP